MYAKLKTSTKLVFIFAVIAVIFPISVDAACSCQTCGSSSPHNTRFCRNLNGASGCSIVTAGSNVISCSCASGGNCFTSNTACNSACPTAPPTSPPTPKPPTVPPTPAPTPGLYTSGIITATFEAKCSGASQAIILAGDTTNRDGSCTLNSCQMDLDNEIFSCDIDFDMADSTENVILVEIHIRYLVGKNPPAYVSMPLDSFPHTSSGKFKTTRPGLSPQFKEHWGSILQYPSGSAYRYIKFVTNKNSNGAISGIFRITHSPSPAPGSPTSSPAPGSPTSSPASPTASSSSKSYKLNFMNIILTIVALFYFI